MSDQAAPAPSPEDHQGPPPSAGQGADPYKLHDDATKASALLESLATGLAHSGAPTKTTTALTKMAEACRAIATAMSRAPAPPEKAAPADKTGESLNGAADSYASGRP